MAEGGKAPKGQGNVFLQGRLVALDRKEVITATVHDDLADRLLGEDRITGDGDPSQRQRLQQHQCGGDLVGIRWHLQLTNNTL